MYNFGGMVNQNMGMYQPQSQPSNPYGLPQLPQQQPGMQRGGFQGGMPQNSMGQGMYNGQQNMMNGAGGFGGQAQSMGMQHAAPQGLLGMSQSNPFASSTAPTGFDQQAWSNSNFTNPGAPNYVDPAGVAGRMQAARAAGNPLATNFGMGMQFQPTQPTSQPANPYAQGSAMGGAPNPYGR